MNNNICKTALLRGGEVVPLIIPTELFQRYWADKSKYT